MSEKILNVRFQIASKKESEWQSSNPILKLGELALSTDKLMFKIGDGTSAWTSLSYTKAIASDVYSWAKASTKPSYSWSEITSKPSTFTPSSHTHATSDITSGTLNSARLPVVPVSKGGTGLSSLTSGQVLIGNGTSNVGFRAIDTTTGGTSGSTSLITSGAVYAGLAKKAGTHSHPYLKLDGSSQMTGDLKFSATQSLWWNGETWQQRIAITDDSTADTAVFSFQQSSNSGSNFTDLMVIRDNGKVIANTFVGNLSGNANTASKLQTARTIALSGSVTGSASFDGSGNITISTSTNHSHNYAGSSSAGGAANSVANSLAIKLNGGGTEGTNLFTFNGSSGKTVNITPSAIGASASGHTHNYAGSSSAGGAANSLSYFKNTSTSDIGIDDASANAIGYVSGTSAVLGQNDGAMYKQTYSSSWVHEIYGDYRTGQIAVRGKNNGTWQGWRTVLDSSNYNSYAPTKTGGGASGSWGISVTGSSASCTGNAATSTKATQDSAGQQINTTYIKGLSVSGRTITYTKGDGSTGTITTQDTNTTYGTGNASTSGLTKLYTGTGSATDGTMTQSAITSALNGKANSSHGKHVPDTCTTITDWNSATTTGWYMAHAASNAPSSEWYFGRVIAHNTNYVYQEVFAFTASTDARVIQRYIRAKMNGTWGAWTEVTVQKKVPSDAKFTDTTYSTGTASALGLTKLYTATGTATDGTMTQKAITDALGGKANSSHSHSYSSITGKPDLLNCMRMYGGTSLDSKGTTADSAAQYNTIALSTATANASGFSKALTDLPKGKYSVMIRMKISANSSSGNIIKVQAGDTNALKTFYVRPNMFTAANTYQTFGFTVDHTTTSFTAKLLIGTALSGVTVNIDYLSIAPAFTAISSVA